MRSASTIAALSIFAVFSLEGAAFAGEPADVRVGEVVADAPRDATLVRASLEGVLAKRPVHHAKRHLVVSAALLACTERTCVVSATLREERGGALVAIVRGSASSEAPSPRDALIRTAAEGAARKMPASLP
ncbi:MAG: hypothetical protein U0183_18430 [Polyangiaceae bacterium]